MAATTRNKIICAPLLVFALLLCSCNRNTVYSKYHTFSNTEWAQKDKAVFEVEINDTLSFNNINIMIRHADAYPYSNLIVFVTTDYPNGRSLTDTMEIMLANAKGEWQGSGAGDIFDLKVPVKKNIRFPQSGKYRFTFEQGMRVDPLPLMMDFGLEIEKSKQ